MSHILALALRYRWTRRLLRRFTWPRPEHIATLTRDEFLAWMGPIGFLHDVEAALAEDRRRGDQADVDRSLRRRKARLSPGRKLLLELAEELILVDPFHRMMRRKSERPSSTPPRPGSSSPFGSSRPT